MSTLGRDAVRSWDEIHDFFERWAIPEWAVAFGTLLLALATFMLSRGARQETKAIVAQSEKVAEQVELQRGQMRRDELPMVFPANAVQWDADRMLVRNVGSGIALNVGGFLYHRFGPEHPWHHVELVPKLFGAGDLNDVRIAGERVGEWDGAYGVIDYDDASGTRYRCSWKLVMIGDKRSAEVTTFGTRAEVPDPEPPEPLASSS